VITLGTRLLSEYLIKKYHPQLRYVRVHTSGKNKATVYAWDDDLKLSEQDIATLKRFTSGYLPSYVCYQIKEYSMVQKDQIPQEHELPDNIVQTAMTRDLDQHGVIDAVNSMLADGRIMFDRYDLNSATLHFSVQSTTVVTEIEKELIRRYLSEMIPLGTWCEISYGMAASADY